MCRPALRRLFHFVLSAALGSFIGSLSIAAAVPTTPGPSAARPPNILFIVADDMGYADVGMHGCTEIPTPNIDALAASGVRFTSAYVSAPICSPSRAGLLTGRYQERFGHEFNPRREQGLPLTERTIADRLRASGYHTALIGKWHLGETPAMHPLQRGFDEFYGFLAGSSHYFGATLLRGTEPVAESEYLTDAFGREAVAFLRRSWDRPWFLMLSFNAVHDPMEATADRLAKFPGVADKARRTYDAMTLAMDDAIGAVRRELAATGQEANTLVVFVNDNGGPTLPGTTRNASINAPLRGSKRTLLEGGIRVALVVSWAGRLKPGVFEQPAIQLDLTATALAVAGVKVQPEWGLDGVDLLPYLQGDQAGIPHPVLYWRLGAQMAIRVGDYKLVRYDSNADTRIGPNQPPTDYRLYNLAADIGETRDLSAAQPQRMADMRAKWEAWNATLIDPLWRNSRDRN